MNNRTLIDNSISATLYNNLIYSTAVASGGGAAFCTLNNCTLSGNWAIASPDIDTYYHPAGSALAQGGGAYSCTLNNCVLVGNSALTPDVRNYNQSVNSQGGKAYSCTLNNCIGFTNRHRAHIPLSGYLPICEDCYPAGATLFVDAAAGNLRLQSNSPCINVGNNSYVTNATDLDGNPRIAGGSVDIGAYEYQAPASMISYTWLQHFNLPIKPAADTADPDGDGVDNYHEWLAGTDPTNPFSSPAQLTIIPAGTNVILTWPTNAVGFTLQSTTYLVSPAVWTTNSPAPVVIAGQNTVTNPITGAQQFYRLGQWTKGTIHENIPADFPSIHFTPRRNSSILTSP